MNVDEFERVLDRILDLIGSASDKVIKLNPGWDELSEVLTADELSVFIAFQNAKLWTIATRRWPMSASRRTLLTHDAGAENFTAPAFVCVVLDPMCIMDAPSYGV